MRYRVRYTSTEHEDCDTQEEVNDLLEYNDVFLITCIE